MSRSKSIASARDRWKLSSSYGLLPFLGKEKQEKEEREEKETERLKEALTVEAGQRIRLERELVVARQEGRQQNEELAELREEQREMMGAETRQDNFVIWCLPSFCDYLSFNKTFVQQTGAGHRLSLTAAALLVPCTEV